jgi:hypothetical protein
MEIIAVALQTVQQGQNVYFTDEVTCGNCSISHRDGSGLVTLRGLTNQCRARFKITFGANIAVPTGGTVEAISLALAINGEAVPATTMIYTPTAAGAFGNVFSAIFVDVPCNCCQTISVQNISAQAIEVQNANLIVERTS